MKFAGKKENEGVHDDLNNPGEGKCAMPTEHSPASPSPRHFLDSPGCVKTVKYGKGYRLAQAETLELPEIRLENKSHINEPVHPQAYVRDDHKCYAGPNRTGFDDHIFDQSFDGISQILD